MRDTELYGLKPTKGTIKAGQSLIAFDAVQRCTNTLCPINEECPYTKQGKCTVIIKYLDAVTNSILTEVGDRMTQPLLNKISLHLMPLFHQLIRMQIYAYSVHDTEVVYRTGQGNTKMHPIFKEVREIIRSIEATQRSMGMDLEYSYAMTEEMGKLGRLKNATVVDPDRGDPDYFERWKGMGKEDVFPDGRMEGVKIRRRKHA